MFGVTTQVSSSYIILFVCFAAFLQVSGVGEYINDLCNALFGWARGGPAKAAVASGALFGSISRLVGGQRGGLRHGHHPHDAQGRLRPADRGRHRGHLVHRRADHAAGARRRRLPDGRDHRYSVRPDRACGGAAGASLLRRLLGARGLPRRAPRAARADARRAAADPPHAHDAVSLLAHRGAGVGAHGGLLAVPRRRTGHPGRAGGRLAVRLFGDLGVSLSRARVARRGARRAGVAIRRLGRLERPFLWSAGLRLAARAAGSSASGAGSRWASCSSPCPACSSAGGAASRRSTSRRATPSSSSRCARWPASSSAWWRSPASADASRR